MQESLKHAKCRIATFWLAGTPSWMLGLPVPLMYRCSPGWVSVLQPEEEARNAIKINSSIIRYNTLVLDDGADFYVWCWLTSAPFPYYLLYINIYWIIYDRSLIFIFVIFLYGHKRTVSGLVINNLDLLMFNIYIVLDHFCCLLL